MLAEDNLDTGRGSALGYSFAVKAEVSVRLLWPFARVFGATPALLEGLREAGVQAADFANPDTRLPHRTVIALLNSTIAGTGDPALGLKAGLGSEPGDLDVLEYAARARPNVKEAIECLGQYFRLLHDSATLTLSEDGDRVLWSFRTTDDVPQPAAANDFILSAMIAFLRRAAPTCPAPLLVRLAHAAPGHATEYSRYFDCPLEFGASGNALVFSSAAMRAPMRHAHPQLARAFASRAERLLAELQRGDGVSGRVRDLVAQRGVATVTMKSAARRLGMSVATLRRRLEAEGTSFSEIVDGVRRSFAVRHLQEGSTTISEVAFLTGFSNVGSFHRAFKRWTGLAPATYRSRKRAPAAAISPRELATA